MDEVYYRLYVNLFDVLRVVEMQADDEADYDQRRFINKTCYGSEEEAEVALLRYKQKAGLPMSVLEKLKIAALPEERVYVDG